MSKVLQLKRKKKKKAARIALGGLMSYASGVDCFSEGLLQLQVQLSKRRVFYRRGCALVQSAGRA